MNGRTFLTVTDLPEFFRGVSFNTSSKRAILPNGAALNRSQLLEKAARRRLVFVSQRSTPPGSAHRPA